MSDGLDEIERLILAMADFENAKIGQLKKWDMLLDAANERLEREIDRVKIECDLIAVVSNRVNQAIRDLEKITGEGEEKRKRGRPRTKKEETAPATAEVTDGTSQDAYPSLDGIGDL